MSLLALPGSEVGGEAPQGALSISETYWGYEIRDRVDRFDRSHLLEPVLRFLGLVLVLTAYGQWFLPASLYGTEAVATKALLCFLLGVAGCWVYWLSSRGFSTQIEVDTVRREIRVVRRNGQGRRRVVNAIRMRFVESAFIQRTKGRASQAHLFLRVKPNDVLLHVADGPEHELEALLRRLSRDMRSPEERLAQSLKASAAFRSRRR